MANTLILFAKKKWVAFALQKLLTFLQQNIDVFENTLSTTVIKFVIDNALNNWAKIFSSEVNLLTFIYCKHLITVPVQPIYYTAP